MGYLRLAHSSSSTPTPESACLAAFDADLDYIFATLHRLGAAHHEVEDLAQEIFVVLLRHWDTLDTSRPLRPYLFGIAFRILSAHRRKRSWEIPCAQIDIESSTTSPENSLQSKQSIAVLRAALEQLPISRRAVVIMHDLDEIPIADIAKNLSITRFGAYARLRKGRMELASAVRRVSRGDH